LNKVTALVIIVSEAVGFGALALYLGYDTVVIGGVLAYIGTMAGYIFGKKS